MDYQLSLRFKEEERQELNDMLRVGDIVGCLHDINQYLRQIVKYTDKENWPTADKIRDEVFSIMKERDVSL